MLRDWSWYARSCCSIRRSSSNSKKKKSNRISKRYGGQPQKPCTGSIDCIISHYDLQWAIDLKSKTLAQRTFSRKTLSLSVHREIKIFCGTMMMRAVLLCLHITGVILLLVRSCTKKEMHILCLFCCDTNRHNIEGENADDGAVVVSTKNTKWQKNVLSMLLKKVTMERRGFYFSPCGQGKLLCKKHENT
jgi:hypothetical protein